GMVYDRGVYHLFYQHYPHDVVWGPMHWGHALSKDLIHWEHRPIALQPDEKGYIFSGCAVADVNNSSGLGTEENYPLVALFTYHDEQAKQTGAKSFQSQALAYSLDQGESWEKYLGNPVLVEESLIDFRDPKVFWHQGIEQWVMILACGDHIRVYHSSNLIEWKYVSSFGEGMGSHAGVWECPDLFELKVKGSEHSKWVMLVSLVKGGPNGGSATQYFIGDFDGFTFTNDGTNEEIRWIDYGTDNYAGVSWSNAPSAKGEKVFIAWMNNWDYATATPTISWRGAMTLPRATFLIEVDEQIYLGMKPHDHMLELREEELMLARTYPKHTSLAYTADISKTPLLELMMNSWEEGIASCEMKFSNEIGECLTIQIERSRNELLLDRGKMQNEELGNLFNPVLKAPLIGAAAKEGIRIFLDTSSVEVFSCGGAINMTAQIFPKESFNKMELSFQGSELPEVDLSLYKLRSIWK
ncbi:MAG: glycoside hydrolase family 32 protein, partial [Bacteroidota bacterium]